MREKIMNQDKRKSKSKQRQKRKQKKSLVNNNTITFIDSTNSNNSVFNEK